MLNLLQIIRYEITIIWRQAFAWLTPLLFFVMVLILFPFAVGPDEQLLMKIAPGIIWVAALLAVLLSIGNLFQNDAQEGYLDVLLASSQPLTLLIVCKVLSHWIMYCLPLILISPLLGLLLHLTFYQEWVLLWSLLLGTPTLTLLGSIGAALTIGIRGQGLLLPILIMPLYMPVLIFGAGALATASLQQPISGYLAILGAFLLLSLVFAPLLTSLALRIGVNQ